MPPNDPEPPARGLMLALALCVPFWAVVAACLVHHHLVQRGG